MLEFRARLRLGQFQLDARFDGPADGVTTLFGSSGAGKSTVLSLLAGARRADEALIVLGGEVLCDTARGIDVPMEKRGLGWVFQDGRLFPHLSVARNLDYGADRSGARPRSIERRRVIDVLGIESLLERRPTALSGGERQRVALARALLAQPRLLLLDEPLASLDAPRKSEILQFITRVKSEFSIPMVYVTHSLAEVVTLADRLVVLEHGSVVASGSVFDVLGRTNVPSLAARQDTGALLGGVISTAESARHTEVIVGKTRFYLPNLPGQPGEPIRLFVSATDVILAAERPGRISVRNIFDCVVTDIEARDAHTVLIGLDLGGGRLLASVTEAAVRELGIAVGSHVYALVKSVAIDAPAGRRWRHVDVE